MPYDSLNDLPDSIKDNLPRHAQVIYKESFNSAWDQYKDANDRKDNATREEAAHKVTWNAVVPGSIWTPLIPASFDASYMTSQTLHPNGGTIIGG